MKKNRQEFLECLGKAGIEWQLQIAKTTELTTSLYFQNDDELHNFLKTFFNHDEIMNILKKGDCSPIRVVNGVQYQLFRVFSSI